MRRDPSLIPLSHQHHNGLALCVLTRRSLAEDASAENIARLAQRAVDRYEIELANHFEIEEQVLFPLCSDQKLVGELVAEHRAMEGMIAGLREAPSAERLEELCVLLNSHIRREESQLFEQAQSELSRESLDRAGEEIDRRAVRVCL
jgi:hemerythrin-like domain-containing protein